MNDEQQRELTRAALAMGYRRMSDGNWGKPFGYTMLTIHTEKRCMEQWFWGANDKLLCWCGLDLQLDPVSYGDFCYQIKEFEEWSVKTGIGLLSAKPGTNFAFVSQEEMLKDIL